MLMILEVNSIYIPLYIFKHYRLLYSNKSDRKTVIYIRKMEHPDLTIRNAPKADPDLALVLRDWILFRNQNYHYKLKVSRVINLWTDNRKTLLKPLLKHLSIKSTSNAWLEIMVIYWDLL